VRSSLPATLRSTAAPSIVTSISSASRVSRSGRRNGYFGINRTRYLSTVHLAYHEAIALVLAGLLLARSIDET
jgi:hypothetical protein